MTQTRTDSQLLKAYLDGDLSAFTRLRECHITMVYATAVRLAPGQAEDVTQAVFLLLAQKAASDRSRLSHRGGDGIVPPAVSRRRFGLPTLGSMDCEDSLALV